MGAADRFDFARHFRLRGSIAGETRTFPLKSGKNSIGRAPSNDLVLAIKGVSQAHAVLTIGPRDLRIEDLSSKNGTFVNRSRISSAKLNPKDEIWIGSAVLVLEELADRQQRLAVDLSPSLALEAWDDEENSATQNLWLNVPLVERWLTSIGEAIAQLNRPPEGRLVRAAESLARATGAAGVAVLELGSASEPVLLAACGELSEGFETSLALLRASDSETPGQAERPPRIGFTTSPEGSLLTICRRIREGAPGLALALCGDFPGLREARPLLGAHLDLLQQLRGDGAASSQTSSYRPPAPLDFPPDYIPGSSPAMEQLHGHLRLLSKGNLPVLLSGETGVGKECIARILHASSDRREGPFVAINCAAVPADLLEAELFGIGPGVATGVRPREGRILKAQGGTLLLDEIGDLPMTLQPKLLRALEEGAIHPVGRPSKDIDVRIVSATNSDLLGRIGAGTFRGDLYYRLAGASLTIPPLRQRREDLPALVTHFLWRFSNEIDKPIRGITVDAMARLGAYDWPGNVRELIHEIRRLVYICPPGEAIETPLLTKALKEDPSGDPIGSRVGKIPFELWLSQAEDLSFQAIECALLAEALRRSRGNQTQAGELLGLSRMAVRRRMERCAGAEDHGPEEE